MLRKLHPDFDPLLAGVLRSDPRAQVVLIRGMTTAWEQKLMARFHVTMPDVVDRIHFLPPQSYADFLQLTSLCDAMLDPIHFGGGNTSYEALAMGVPVITLPSGFLRGRITYALYRQMGMDDCIARDNDHYIELATMLAADQSIRERIVQASSVLFDNDSGVRELEAFLVSVTTR